MSLECRRAEAVLEFCDFIETSKPGLKQTKICSIKMGPVCSIGPFGFPVLLPAQVHDMDINRIWVCSRINYLFNPAFGLAGLLR